MGFRPRPHGKRQVLASKKGREKVSRRVGACSTAPEPILGLNFEAEEKLRERPDTWRLTRGYGAVKVSPCVSKGDVRNPCVTAERTDICKAFY